MKTIKINIYEFEELSKDIQAKVIENNRDINTNYNWDKWLLDEAVINLASIGFLEADIEYSGFWSQGDGLKFNCNVDVKKWFNLDKTNKKKYPKCYKYIDDITASISDSGYYSHSNNMSIDINCDYEGKNKKDQPFLNAELMALEVDILDHAKNEADKLYRELEKIYDELSSEEMIIKTIKANELTFEVNGRARNV